MATEFKLDFSPDLREKKSIFFLEKADNESELLEAKALDDLAFGLHMGITLDELREIAQNGAVLLLRDSEGKLVGESQVIISPISQHPTLSEDEAFNCGTAVHPNYQNHGLAQVLFRAQEEVALQSGKSRNTLTARLENAQSLRGRFKAGYTIVGYSPSYYGPMERDGARVLVEKNHKNLRIPFMPNILAEGVISGKIEAVDNENIDLIISQRHDFIVMAVNVGDEVDLHAHNLVGRILSSGHYKGIGLLKPGEVGMIPGNQSLLVFKNS